MRYLLTTHLLLLASVAFAAYKPSSCELADRSVIGRTSSGLAQVSNLGDIEITCKVPAQPSPGESLYVLRVATVAYQILPDGSKKLVPSEASPSGAGSSTETVSIPFHFHIPLESVEQDAEAARLVARLEKAMPSEQITEDVHRRALERARKLLGQHRVGHFQVECRVLDGGRVMGVALVELEVLFKGRVSDIGLVASPA